jgi:hypothetical protein
MKNHQSMLASFGAWLFQQARQTEDEQSLEQVHVIAFGMSELLSTGEIFDQLLYDLFTEIMLYIDHRRWKKNGSHNLEHIEQEIIRYLLELEES